MSGLRVCVFCGARTGRAPRYRAAAERLADALVAARLGVVFGGGRVGLMGVLADRVLARGGEIVSVIPDYLRREEVEHRGVSARHVVADLFERKGRMLELSHAFIALPGGMGTYDELFEVLTWRQLGQLGDPGKPIAILNDGGYFDPFLALLRHTVAEGFLEAQHLDHVLVHQDVDRLLAALTAQLPVTAAAP